MASTKRMRGLTVHRGILIGNTSTPLTEAEKLSAPPDHTHKWTVAVRSVASHPLPNIPGLEQGGLSATLSGNPGITENSNSQIIAVAGGADGGRASGSNTPVHSGMSTRGREHETDYHKMVGGKDDISHFVKRVHFKLHETYPQALRNIDKPPFQVTETGWGEFDIQVKIFFVPESGEKPVTLFHRLKLHPWHPVSIPAPAPSLAEGQDMSQTGGQQDDTLGESTEIKDTTSVKDEESALVAAHETRSASAAANPVSSARRFPPVVHSWSYDEVVFPEPTEAFYEILLANPPSQLPALSSQAFSDPQAFRTYRAALDQLNEISGPHGRDINMESAIQPPHPLYDPSGALFDALSQEAILAEGERLDKARFNAVHELEETRSNLIDAERKLRDIRPKLTSGQTPLQAG